MSKSSLVRLFSSLLLTMLVVACGGSGGSGNASASGSTGSNSPYTGLVLDGYLQGAKVCFDKNMNFSCDLGEASTTTDSKGGFILNVDTSGGGQYLVQVTTSTVDLDTGNTVTAPYVLAAPVGQQAAITPLTTLVALAMVTQSELTLSDVREQLQAKTGLANVFGDYIANGNTEAHAVAQATATVLAQKLLQLQGIAPSLSARQALMVVNEELDPAEMRIAADDGTVQTNGSLDLTKLAQSPYALLQANTTVVAQRVAALALADKYADPAQVKAVSATSVLVGDHATSLSSTRSLISGVGEYFNSSNHEFLQDSVALGFSNAVGTWSAATALPNSGTQRMLLNASTQSWQAYSGEWLGVVNSDGTLTLSNTYQSAPLVISYKSVDLSGQLMSSWLDPATLASPSLLLANANATFPSGAKAILSTWKLQGVGYSLDSATNYTSLAQVLALAGGSSGMLQTWIGNEIVNVAFAAHAADAQSGQAMFYDEAGGNASLGQGTWSLQTVSGQSLLILNAPPKLHLNGYYAPSRIAAVYNGQVYFGGRYDAASNSGQIQHFNDVALNAIAANLQQNLSANAGVLRIHYWQGTSADTDPGVWVDSGFAETTPSVWPADRLLFVLTDGNGWSYQDVAVANGASSVSFDVVGSNGNESCNTGTSQHLSYTLPGTFATSRFTEIWVEGCNVETAVFPRITGHVRIWYDSSTAYGAGGYPNWGIWTWQGTTSPVPQNYPADRVLFNISNGTVSGTNWVAADFDITEDILNNNTALAFLVVDQNGNQPPACNNTQALQYSYTAQNQQGYYNSIGVGYWIVAVGANCTVSGGDPTLNLGQ